MHKRRAVSFVSVQYIGTQASTTLFLYQACGDHPNIFYDLMICSSNSLLRLEMFMGK